MTSHERALARKRQDDYQRLIDFISTTNGDDA